MLDQPWLNEEKIHGRVMSGRAYNYNCLLFPNYYISMGRGKVVSLFQHSHYQRISQSAISFKDYAKVSMTNRISIEAVVLALPTVSI